MEVFYLLEQSPIFLLVATFAFSLLIGSFLNVVIFRFPKSMQHEWTNDSVEHLIETFEELKQPLAKYSQQPKPPSIIWARSNCQHCNYQIKVSRFSHPSTHPSYGLPIFLLQVL